MPAALLAPSLANASASADPAAAASDPLTGAESIRWNLADLYTDTADLDADLAAADAEAESLASDLRGELATLRPSQVAAGLDRIAAVHERLGRAYTYAYLHWSTATEDAERGALLQSVRERYTKTGQRLLFFDVEWARLSDDKAAKLLAAPELARFHHYLELQRLQKEHVLSEPEEAILSEKAVTGRSAWTRFFDETLGAKRFRFQGESVPEQAVLAKLHDADRAVREAAAESLTAGLEELERPLAYVFNTVLADKASTDRLRGYDHWLASRNHANEITADSVDALIGAVTGRYDLSQRFYRLKKRLLGLDEMMDYDRYAPLPQIDGEASTDRRFSWTDAQAAVLGAYADFHPEMGRIARLFFDGEWIDAAVVAGKRGGAFSHGAVPSAHPYVLMNYTGKVRDVQTLAHELGHGVHQYLSRSQGVFHASTPLTTAETASVFGEMLVFQRLLKAETEPARPPRAARPENRRLDGDGLPAGDDEPLRGPHPPPPPRNRRTGPGRLRAALDGDADGHVRRRRDAGRPLRALVELHPALCPHAGLRLRLCVRRAARARALRPLQRDRRRFCRGVPRAARERWLRLAARAAETARHRPQRRVVLEAGPVRHRGPDRGGGDGRAGAGKQPGAVDGARVKLLKKG